MQPALRYDKDQRYYDLLAYMVSNTVAGEIMAIENYSEMVPLLATTDEKIETVQQAHDEAKHVRVLSKLGDKLDFTVMQQIIEPQWRNIRKYYSSEVQKGNLASCLISQDLMVETMAIVLYRTLGRNTDPETAKFAGNILEDEIRHLGIGIDRIKALVDKDPEHVHACLERSHDAVMPEMFGMISYNCQSLCGDLGVECATLGLDSLSTDLDNVRVEALDTYMEMLDKVGFDTKVTTPLIAGMAAYAKPERVGDELRTDGCSTTRCC